MTLDDMIAELKKSASVYDEGSAARRYWDERVACLCDARQEFQNYRERATQRLLEVDRMREASSRVLGKILSAIPPNDIQVDGTIARFVDPDPQETIRMIGKAIREAAQLSPENLVIR